MRIGYLLNQFELWFSCEAEKEKEKEKKAKKMILDEVDCMEV